MVLFLLPWCCYGVVMALALLCVMSLLWSYYTICDVKALQCHGKLMVFLWHGNVMLLGCYGEVIKRV